MNISKINAVNFGALLGKKEVNYYHGSGLDKMKTIQHIYPFKDEFVNSKSQKEEMEKFKKTNYYSFQEISQGISKSEYEIAVEKPLDFTKEEFLQAKQHPRSKDVSKKALEFIKSDEYNTTKIKHFGAYPTIFVQDGQVEFK